MFVAIPVAFSCGPQTKRGYEGYDWGPGQRPEHTPQSIPSFYLSAATEYSLLSHKDSQHFFYLLRQDICVKQHFQH